MQFCFKDQESKNDTILTEFAFTFYDFDLTKQTGLEEILYANPAEFHAQVLRAAPRGG